MSFHRKSKKNTFFLTGTTQKWYNNITVIRDGGSPYTQLSLTPWVRECAFSLTMASKPQHPCQCQTQFNHQSRLCPVGFYLLDIADTLSRGQMRRLNWEKDSPFTFLSHWDAENGFLPRRMRASCVQHFSVSYKGKPNEQKQSIKRANYIAT